MAIYHLTEGGVSPARGSSAVRASAYQSGEALTDERTGEIADYGRKGRVVASGVELPDGAPEWAADRGALWNRATAAWGGGTELVARRVEAALPRELGLADQVALVRALAARETARGRAVDWAIHDAGDGNPHVHMLVSALPLGEGGFERPTESRTVKVYLCRDAEGLDTLVRSTDWKSAKEAGYEKVYTFKDGERRTLSEAAELGLTKADRKSANPVSMNCARESGTPSFDAERARLAADRAAWADLVNAALERAGSESRVDHRSNRERGLEAVPTVHEGSAVTAMERRAGADAGDGRPAATDRRRLNDAIRALNARLAAVAAAARRAAVSAVVTARDWWVRRAPVGELRRWGADRRAGIARARARAVAEPALDKMRQVDHDRDGAVDAMRAELVARREAELAEVEARQGAALAAEVAERAARAAQGRYDTLNFFARRGSEGRALLEEAARQRAACDAWRAETGEASPSEAARALARRVEAARELVETAREMPDRYVEDELWATRSMGEGPSNASLADTLARGWSEPARGEVGRLDRSRGR